MHAGKKINNFINKNEIAISIDKMILLILRKNIERRVIFEKISFL